MCDVAIAWAGLPFYAARLIRHAIEQEGLELTVLGTPPLVPYAGIEDTLGRQVAWVGKNDRPTWQSIGKSVPGLFFHTGWAQPAFNALADQVLAKGGRVVAMVDNRYRGDLRQVTGAAWFRLRLRYRFSAFWVPGISGKQLATFLGMPDAAIVQGLYSADPLVFRAPAADKVRSNDFIFIGQLIPRKGLLQILSALDDVRRYDPAIRFRIVGDGPLRQRVVNHPSIDYVPFAQPSEVARHLQTSRFLVLPSLDENWGLVVHEAMLAGCGAILSDRVGSAFDLLLDGQNGRLVRAGSVDELTKAMLGCATLSSNDFTMISHASQSYAARFSPSRWAQSFLKCMEIAWKH